MVRADVQHAVFYTSYYFEYLPAGYVSAGINKVTHCTVTYVRMCSQVATYKTYRGRQTVKIKCCLHCVNIHASYSATDERMLA